MEEVVAAITGATPAPVSLRDGAMRSPGASTRAALTRTVASTDGGRLGRTTRFLVASAALTLAGGAFVAWRVGSTSPAPAASTGPAACTSNAACTAEAGGVVSICRRADGVCVPLASEDCRPLATPEEQASDATVWFGLMLPRREEPGDFFNEVLGTIDLARSDFHVVGGLPARPGDARTRPIGVLECDDAVDAKRAAAHLLDVGVPAVMGFGELAEALDLSANVFVPRRVLVANVTSNNPLITRVAQPAGDPRLVWRLVDPDSEATGEAMTHVVTDYLEPSLRRPGGPLAAPDARLRVLLLRATTPNPRALGEAIVARLRVNGKSASETDDFRSVLYRDDDASKRAAAEEVAAFAPHVILTASGSAYDPPILEAIEEAWRAPYRPLYVRERTVDPPKLARFVGSNGSRRRRFFGVDLPTNRATNFNFTSHYNEAHSPPFTPSTSNATGYDTFYALAFAAAAVDGDLTGPAMGSAMARIRRDGTPVSVGATGILSAFAALRAGGALALEGAASTFDLDLRTGENRPDFAVYCLKALPDGSLDATESGLRFDHVKKHIEGTAHCE
jgi:hypothetical protein